MEIQYYIFDTTLGNQPTFFSTLQEVVSHLEGTVKRETGLSRRDYMQNLTDLGHGLDDPAGKVFTQSMSERFNIGIYTGVFKKCNIHEYEHFLKYRNECGD